MHHRGPWGLGSGRLMGSGWTGLLPHTSQEGRALLVFGDRGVNLTYMASTSPSVSEGGGFLWDNTSPISSAIEGDVEREPLSASSVSGDVPTEVSSAGWPRCGLHHQKTINPQMTKDPSRIRQWKMPQCVLIRHNVSKFFDCSMLLYYLFWMFNRHLYAILY